MAAVNSKESPSSSSSRCRYQVFLSFRGADTRQTFISHLHAALVQAGIHTFIDDDEIPRGENIELELQKAIRHSKIAIIVFSEDYASSRWCLDELVMVMKQKGTAGWKVLPVFYHVDPSDVRKQTGSFARAFVKHEKRPLEQVNGWRLALKEAADLAGMVFREGREAEFVKSIVKKVSKELNPTKFHVPYFIGRDLLMNYINSWLQRGSNDTEIAVLYGIGGVGKTTIAKSVYNQNLDNFESISFLGNIGQKSKQSDGLLSLQTRLLHDVLNNNTCQIHDVDEGIMMIKDAICCKKILLILDDVDTKDQFNALIGMREWPCPGSKIIVTTRNKGLFAIHEEVVKLKIEPLDEKDSIEVFSWHAFGQPHPVEEFAERSKNVVHHCNGLPLALSAIGSSLSYTRTKEIWESKLQEMEKIPDSEVQKVLRISYESLNDVYQKDLFLDVACFFIGMEEDYVVHILNGLGIGAKWRIDNLMNRCLVEIDNSNRLWMHKILRDMGREIAREYSPQCRRIWHNEEAFTMLKEITDIEVVRGLTLDMHALMGDGQRNDHDFLKRHHVSGFFSLRWLSSYFSENQVQIGQKSLFPILNTVAFKRMQKIKFLRLNYVQFNGSYEQFPKSLLWLHWHGFYLRSIPKQCSLEKLVVLDMQCSNLVNVWEGKMPFPRLKILDLSHSHCLIRTPDFSYAPNLESLILEYCINLVEIHQSIGELHGLFNLNLRGCQSLEEIPEEISKLDSLKKLILDGCSNLDGLYIKLEHQLQPRWSLYGGGIVSIISHKIAMPLKLFFQFWFSKRKENMRVSIFSLPHFLVELNLDGTPIHFLPESIKDLSTLEKLSLVECRMLQQVPELPTSLQTLFLDGCSSLEKVPDVFPFSWTTFTNCELLVFQEWLKQDFIRRVVDTRMFMIMVAIMGQFQNVPWSLEIMVASNVLNVLLHDRGGKVSMSLRDKAWMPLHDVLGTAFELSLANQGHNKFLGFMLYTRVFISLPLRNVRPLHFGITNNTKGQSKHYFPLVPTTWMFFHDTKEEAFDALWTNCWVGGGDLVFEGGDELSAEIYSIDPAMQIQMVAIEALTANENDFTELKKAEIASSIFRYFNCCFRAIDPAHCKCPELYFSFLRRRKA